MSLVDTSVLIYASNTDCREYQTAKNILKQLSDGPETWHLTWQNIFEFIRSMTNPKSSRIAPFYIDEAVTVVRKLLATPSLQLIHPGPRHFEIFAEIAAHTPGVRGNLVQDARIAAIMIENGVRKIYTADEGFRRFRDVEVINVFK